MPTDDPNVCKVAAWLRDNDFAVVEGYDGEHRFEGLDDGAATDLECEGVPRFPLVILEVLDHEDLVKETNRLFELVGAVVGEVFPWIDEGSNPDMAIQARFDPTEGRAYLLLSHLTDDIFDPRGTL
jgi:hypothetical protein